MFFTMFFTNLDSKITAILQKFKSHIICAKDMRGDYDYGKELGNNIIIMEICYNVRSSS